MKNLQLRKKILSQYEECLLTEGKPPASVTVFCKALKIKEASFYAEFSSLEAVERAIWGEWMNGLIEAISSGKEWESFSAKERYLAFLYGFVGSALEKRSLLLNSFSKSCHHENLPRLNSLKQAFTDFASEIVSHGVEQNEIANRGPLLSLYPEVLYIHWRLVLDHYLKDESSGYERTDAFIEKSVEFAFDLFKSQAIDSAADLARFLLPKSSWFEGMKGK